MRLPSVVSRFDGIISNFDRHVKKSPSISDTRDVREKNVDPRTTPIYRRLSTLVEWAGLEKSEIARRLGKTETWTGRRLLGETSVLAHEIEWFAEALRVPATALVDDAVFASVVQPHPHPTADQPYLQPVETMAERMERRFHETRGTASRRERLAAMREHLAALDTLLTVEEGA
jgi:transcriptional regulator with XRE-family HTH domain